MGSSIYSEKVEGYNVVQNAERTLIPMPLLKDTMSCEVPEIRHAHFYTNIAWSLWSSFTNQSSSEAIFQYNTHC
jgi:hypothetical protein